MATPIKYKNRIGRKLPKNVNTIENIYFCNELANKVNLKLFKGNDVYQYEINPNEFLSMGRSTPFAGEKVFGQCIATIYKDKFVYGNLENYK